MRCAVCQSESDPAGRFCGQCGNPLTVVDSCGDCGGPISPGDRFCSRCGSPLSLPRADEERSFTADRRQITVLFSDVVDSTEHARRLDPEDWRDLVHAYHDVCIVQVERFGGYIAQFLGDGVLVYFGYPVARETDGEGCVRAALGILEGVAALNAQSERTGRSKLQVRFGIHSGPVLIDPSNTRREPPATGDTVHLASRFEQLAAADTIAISDTTRSLVDAHFECADLGMHDVKGFAEPVRAWRIVGARRSFERLSPAALGGLPPMVGRDAELAVLTDRWRRARDGHGCVVTCIGDAGLGKSRLVAELRARLLREQSLWLAGTCSPFRRNSALSPLIELARQGVGWNERDEPSVRAARLEAEIADVSEDAFPLLARLLGHPVARDHPALARTPEELRAATLDAFVAWLRKRAKEKPAVVLLEDVHWADPSTLAFLRDAVRWVPSAPILLVATMRPEIELVWERDADVTPIRLPKLTSKQTADLVASWTVETRLARHRLDQIIEKTGGIPLFVEMLARTVAENAPEVDDRIPASLQDLLEARLDAMGPAREVARFGAVIGRRFDYEIIAAISQLPEDRLRRDLQTLVDADILHRPHAFEPTYEFTHSLIHESAYEAILRSDRRALHARVARELEERSPDLVRKRPEHLALHYAEAGRHDVALQHWERAARRAMRAYANEEAVAHAQSGLDALRRIRRAGEHPDAELRLLMIETGALVASRGFGNVDVEPVATRALALARTSGDERATTGALNYLCSHAMQRSQYGRARELSAELVVRSRALGDRRGSVTARLMACATLLWCAEYEESLRCSAEGIELHDPADFETLPPSATEAGIHCRCVHALALWATGHAGRALALGRSAVEMAREREHGPHPYTLAWTLTFLLQLLLHRRDAKDALVVARELETLAREHRFQRLVAWGVSLGACARLQQGDVETAVETLERSLAEYPPDEAGYWYTYCNGLVAWGLGQVGRFDRAFERVASARSHAARFGERFNAADLHRIEGDLILAARPDDHAAAETAYLQALDLARETGGVAWELRALIHLARLRAAQGRAEEGLATLRPLYDRLADRGETVDLQDAAALLGAT